MFRYAVILACVSTSFAVVPFASVTAALATIQTDVAKLSSDTSAFTNDPTLVSALKINTDSGTLVTAIEDATTDVNGFGAFTDSEGDTILATFESLEPSIIGSLNAVVAAKTDFDDHPLGGVGSLVESDLKSLSSASGALETALINNAPADLKPSASVIASSINAAFATAIAAFA